MDKPNKIDHALDCKGGCLLPWCIALFKYFMMLQNPEKCLSQFFLRFYFTFPGFERLSVVKNTNATFFSSRRKY